MGVLFSPTLKWRDTLSALRWPLFKRVSRRNSFRSLNFTVARLRELSLSRSTTIYRQTSRQSHRPALLPVSKLLRKRQCRQPPPRTVFPLACSCSYIKTSCIKRLSQKRTIEIIRFYDRMWGSECSNFMAAGDCA